MAHGKPDWGLVGPKQTIYGLDDVGEAAARLGSPVIWDRRGDVILMDSFEHGTCMSATTVFGAADNYNILCGASRHGGLSLRYYLGGVGVSQGQTQWTVCSTGRMVNGFELSFGWVDSIDWIQWHLQYYDGVNIHDANIRFVPATGVFSYRSTPAGWVVLANPPVLVPFADPIHVIKVVADFDQNQYVRVIVDEHAWTLPGVPLWDAGGGAGPRINCYVSAACIADETSAFIMDRIIITQNEPL